MIFLIGLCCFGIPLLIWIFMFLRPDRFYCYHHVFTSQNKEQLDSKKEKDSTNSEGRVSVVGENKQPNISVIIPARNEALALPHTLPSIVGQDYANLEVILINDQSTDGTDAIAYDIQAQNMAGSQYLNSASDFAQPNQVKSRLQILQGQSLPPGWAGKLWAVEQGVKQATGEWILLTDADLIYSHPKMVSQLIALALRNQRDMISLMARLQTQYFWEKLLIPAFLYFFKMLYPFSQIPDPKSHIAAAAGGCILIRRTTLEAIGGIAAIRQALIDDVALARAVKDHHFSIELLDGPELISHRGYNDFAGIWRMVARSAFTELKYSYLRLLGCTLGLLLIFFAPLLAILGPIFFALCKYFFLTDTSHSSLDLSFLTSLSYNQLWLMLAIGLLTWLTITLTYFPTVRYYKLSFLWATSLPFAGLLYLAMTLDSARRYLFGIRAQWKDRQYNKEKSQTTS